MKAFIIFMAIGACLEMLGNLFWLVNGAPPRTPSDLAINVFGNAR